MAPNLRKAERHTVPGSEKTLPKGARLVGRARADERVEVTVLLRSKNPLPSDAELCSPSFTPVSREEFHSRYCATLKDIRAIETFAHAHGLTILRTSSVERTMVLAGTVEPMQAAFGVKLQTYQLGKVKFRGRKGSISVPVELGPIVEGVFGLDNRAQARSHLRVGARTSRSRSSRQSGLSSFTPIQVAQLYKFPSGLDGSGQCVAILEFGGGYRPADLTQYFASLNVPVPAVTAVSVSGAVNAPTGNPNGDDGEVLLDIEVAGAIAPKATIAVYFAPNSDAGFVNALKAAVHDTVRQPSVVSISWGGPEPTWTKQGLAAFNQACQEAAALGVTICCSAGDNGAQDQPGTKRATVDFPASCPFVLACGGTRLQATGTTISSETVWNDGNGGATGGGVSEVFPVPAYQANTTIPPSANLGGRPGRGVPDVAGNADPQTGYQVRVDGQSLIFGGTSAVAPLWAALIALLNQGKGRNLGFVNPKLYQLPANPMVLRDIKLGDNRTHPSYPGYAAGSGWDACTGLGSPNGNGLLNVI